MQNRNLNKEGVGLGLAVCKKLAHALNGDIFVESKLEEGSKFTLSIPLVLLTTHDELLLGHVLPINSGLGNGPSNTWSEGYNLKQSSKEIIPFFKEQVIFNTNYVKPSI